MMTSKNKQAWGKAAVILPTLALSVYIAWAGLTAAHNFLLPKNNIELLKSEDTQIVAKAVLNLSNDLFGEDVGVALYLQLAPLLSHKDPFVRGIASITISDISRKHTEYAEWALDKLKDVFANEPDAKTRIQIVYSVKRIGTKHEAYSLKAIDTLKAFSEDGDEKVKKYALDGIKEIQETFAVNLAIHNATPTSLQYS